MKLEFNYQSGWVVVGGGGWWVVGQNESNTKLNSVLVEFEVRVELGNIRIVKKSGLDSAKPDN